MSSDFSFSSSQFLDNGLIVLTKENAVKYGYPNPFSSGFTAGNTIPMIAPFWADVDFEGGSGEVFYQVNKGVMQALSLKNKKYQWHS